MMCVCIFINFNFLVLGREYCCVVRMCTRTNRHGNDTIPRIADGHDCQTVEEKPRLHVPVSTRSSYPRAIWLALCSNRKLSVPVGSLHVSKV